MNSEARIQELEARVEQLTAMVELLATSASPQGAPTVPADRAAGADPSAPATPLGVDEMTAAPTTASRRGLLKLAGAAAAGAVAATASNVMPVAAADADPLQASRTVSTTNSTTDTTVLAYTSTATPTVAGAIFGTFADANIFNVRDTQGGLVFGSSSQSLYPAAIGGYSYRTVANGLYGFTANAGYGVVGFATGTAGVGMLARGAKANVELYSAGTAPSERTDAHTKGELVNDANGDAWLCVVSGTPGTWRRLAGPGTSGSLQLLASPKRVYSSRAADEPVAIGPKTPLSAGTRTIDCTVASSGVPAGATGVVLNVTAIAASVNGYLSVSPGGAGFSGTSTLNWTANGAIVANGVTVGTGTGAKIDVTIGGGGTADFIVDVMGYYL